MSVKHFVVNPKKEVLSKDQLNLIYEHKLEIGAAIWDEREKKAQIALEKECPLKHTYGRVIVKVDMEMKNRYTFSNGLTIRRERKFNNFNFREVTPTNCIVVSAENIPKGSEILVDYTAIQDSYRIFGYDSGSYDVLYYSLRECDCFAWKDVFGNWLPLENSEFGLRVYRPYEGRLSFITPELLKDILYVTTGELKGYVVNTLKGCDYQIVFSDEQGKEKNIIRFRHSQDPTYNMEEVICINNELTDLLNEGKLIVGLTPTDAKTLNEL